jgi:molybdopterin synthase catalytic subunit
MKVLVAIVDGPLTVEAQAAVRGRAAEVLSTFAGWGVVGARVRFEGIVRRSEPCAESGGKVRALTGLEYHTYDPMAHQQLEVLAERLCELHGLSAIVALHSRGLVGVGEVCFVLEVSAAHRAPALAAAAQFIDELKRDVPIWKMPVWAI